MQYGSGVGQLQNILSMLLQKQRAGYDAGMSQPQQTIVNDQTGQYLSPQGPQSTPYQFQQAPQTQPKLVQPQPAQQQRAAMPSAGVSYGDLVNSNMGKEPMMKYAQIPKQEIDRTVSVPNFEQGMTGYQQPDGTWIVEDQQGNQYRGEQNMGALSQAMAKADIQAQKLAPKAPTPKYDQNAGGWVYPPDAKNPQGKFIPAPPGMEGTPMRTPEDVKAQLTPTDYAIAQKIAAGKDPGMTGYALKNPQNRKIMGAAIILNPEWDASLYHRRQQTSTAFSKGVQGNAVRAVNQALYHMGTLKDAIKELSNFGGVMTPLNYPANLAESAFGNPAQGKFKQAALAVANELRKAFMASGGGSLEELRQWQDSLPLNASPEQQNAYLQQGAVLLHGALNALNNQYQAGMGPNANIGDLITPQAQKTLNEITGGAEGQKSTSPQKITSDAEYEALPSGTEFIAPDGSHRRKP